MQTLILHGWSSLADVTITSCHSSKASTGYECLSVQISSHPFLPLLSSWHKTSSQQLLPALALWQQLQAATNAALVTPHVWDAMIGNNAFISDAIFAQNSISKFVHLTMLKVSHKWRLTHPEYLNGDDSLTLIPSVQYQRWMFKKNIISLMKLLCIFIKITVLHNSSVRWTTLASSVLTLKCPWTVIHTLWHTHAHTFSTWTWISWFSWLNPWC